MFQVVYWNHSANDGEKPRRVRKHFAKKEDAETYLKEINRKISREGTAGIWFDAKLRSDAITARQTLDAAGHTATPLTLAVSAYVERHKTAQATHQLAEPILRQFLQEKEIVEGCAHRTIQTLRNRLTKWLDDTGIATLSEITRERIEAMRIREGVIAQSRRNDMAALSTWCSWMLDKGLIDHHPMRGLKRPKLPPANKATFSPEECGRVLATARAYLNGRWLPAVAVMIWTGCRPSELAQTRLVYGREAIARIEGGKLRGRANRTVPLSAAAKAWLKVAGNPEAAIPLHTRARRTIATRAGVNWGADICRHTYISYRIAETQDEQKVAQEAGTSPQMIHRHYRSLKLAKEARAWAGLRP